MNIQFHPLDQELHIFQNFSIIRKKASLIKDKVYNIQSNNQISKHLSI